MRYVTQLIAIAFAAMFMVSCSNGQNKGNASNGIAEDVDVTVFEKQMNGAQLLDVRTPEEWSEGIIEGATMMNFYDSDFAAQLEKLDKDQPVAVYCRSGGRSGKAMGTMNEMGFKEVYNLEGGIGAWNNADKPTVKP